MTTVSLGTWLAGLGLQQYENLFRENDVDFDILHDLSEDDLEKLGVSLGHRKKLLRAIAAHAESPASPAKSAGEPETLYNESPFGPSEAERRQLTVMFCDLVGSTALAEGLDPEDFRNIIRRYQDACAGAISRFDGYIAKFIGDGLLVYFGFPRAHEDDAERAVRSALGILKSLAEFESGHESDQEKIYQVRIGIATGPVVVGDIVGEGASQEEMVMGATPNLAARLQGLATPNAIVIAAVTRELLGEHFDFEDLGQQTLKGIAEPVQAWRVSGERVVESRFGARHAERLTMFVGRDQEVELLFERWRQARGGEGQAVLLSGQAGIGKSRISETLRDRLRNEKHLRIRYQCSPHHTNSPLYPAIRQLEIAAGFVPEDTTEEKFGKLEKLLQQSDLDEDAIFLLAALLSIDGDARCASLDMTPQEQKQKTLLALAELFERHTAQCPVLFLLEDAHWIDPTTQELVDLLIDRLPSLPAMLLVTYRPEYEPPWLSYPYCTVLALNHLSRDACEALVDDLTGGKRLPEEVLEQIISKTDGVPLFVEELTKTILESGLLSQQDGHYALAGALPPLAIPSTIQDSLMARLDRLETVKEIAQIGAAIGREFSYALLDAVSPLKGRQLEEALVRLREAEIVFQRGVPPDATYVFKHALIQDTAYEALLRSRRQQIHASIADALQTSFKERVTNEPEVLAHHYTEAGLWDHAARQWLLAGRRAVAHSANLEAIAHISCGLQVLRELPREKATDNLELDMQICLGSARIAAKGYSSAETEYAYLRGRELLAEIGEDPRQFAVLHGLSMVYWNRAQHTLNLEVTEDVLERAKRQNDPLPKLVAHRLMAVALNPLARFEEAFEHAQQAVKFHDPARHSGTAHEYGHDMGVGAHWHLSIASLFLGYQEASAEAANKALSLTQELKNANTTSYNALWTAFTRLVSRDWTVARDTARIMIDEAMDRSMALWVVFGRHLLGSALANLNEPEAALEEISRGRAEAEQVNNAVFKPMTLRFEAQALTELGRFDEAIARLNEALNLIETTNERWWEAEVYRALGRISVRRDAAPADSQVFFERAIEVARNQKAKLFELRAATSLADLWHSNGRFEDARSLLSPTYNWFSEGLETIDLHEAKIMLGHLSQSK